eukprot:Em0009g609a
MSQQAVVEIVRDAKNKATVNLFGATLLSWIHDESEMIFVSKGSTFDNKKAIRGGIPIVFPNFGPWDLGRPNHGFARINMWRCTAPPQKDSNGDAAAVFTLTDSEETRKMWQDNRFELNYTVTVKVDGLNTQLTIKNLNSTASFDFTCLFHTYFNVPDVSKITISGLGGLTYKDKTDDFKEKMEKDDPKSINGYTDSVYASALKDHLITNVAGGKTVCLKKTNFPDTVIWNPWAERAKSVELVENEYAHMICVEAGYVSKQHTVQAGELFAAGQTIQII